MEYKDLTIFEIVEGIKSQQFTSESVVKYFIDRCREYEYLNAIIEVFDDAISQAKLIDEKIKKGEKLGMLAGLPIAIKDNILCKGKKCGCGSAFMQDFIAPYSATLVKRLQDQGAIIFARTNMDEFAMGGSCENSYYGACKNAIDQTRVAGGSSGGSAVAVSAGLCPVAIGTDTGGSIRQPSSFNGVVGIKPTYGSVSRYGVVAFASSTDQASPITKTVKESQYILQIMSGKDEQDATSIVNDFGEEKSTLTIGICKQLKGKIASLKSADKFYQAIEKLKQKGCKFVDVDVPHIENSLACYYVISPAEATSNLARFDGVKYTTRAKDAKTLEQVYIQSRSQGFGQEVKRRIMLGNFVLSSGYFDAYYKKAQRLQQVLKDEFSQAFKQCDVIMTPTTPDVAFLLGGKLNDPVSMYLEDLFTVPASLAGIPAISVPYAKQQGLPLGMQFMADKKQESTLYQVAKLLEKISREGE